MGLGSQGPRRYSPGDWAVLTAQFLTRFNHEDGDED